MRLTMLAFGCPIMGKNKMKLKFVFAMMAASGLFIAPALAGDPGKAKAAVEASAEGSVAAYVVAAEGGG